MKIETEFSVAAPPQKAFEFLLDLERVAPCIPGGELGAPDGDGVYPANVTVKLGPMRLVYDGTIRIAEQDDATRTARLSARARESRGSGTAQATMTMTISPDGSGSRVGVTTELELTGRAAQLGRGVVEDVATRLVGEMASCLAERIPSASEATATAAPKPLSAPALLLQIVRGRLRALLRR